MGGVSAVVTKMQAIDGFLDSFPKGLALPGMAGALLFVISWMFAGFSVIGQPHVMVRFMTLSDTGSMNRARFWYYTWFTAFYLVATGVGLLSRIYFADMGSMDTELALPTMALQLLPPVLVGLILAGIFAATMSTADSVVLSCSAAVTHDLLPHKIEHRLLIKLGDSAGHLPGAALGAGKQSERVQSGHHGLVRPGKCFCCHCFWFYVSV